MLQRGVVTVANPSDGADELWSPTLKPRPVEFVLDPDAHRWGVQLPVVYDDVAPDTAVSLVHWPVAPGTEVPIPSGLERLCPSPSVADYVARLEGDTEEDTVVRAFALRMIQLTPYEAQRIARVADGVVSDALLDRVHNMAPGLEYSPRLADDVLDHLPYETLGKRRHRLLHGMCVAVMRLRARGLRRALDRPGIDDLRAVLAPFVAVCGPIPEIDVVAVPADPEPATAWPPPPVLRIWPVGNYSMNSVVWTDLVGDAPPEGEVFAAIPSPATTFADVAVGRNCTYHRMRVPTLDGARYRVLLEPALPRWPADQLRLVPVDWCRRYLAQYPIVTTQPVTITTEPDLLWRAATTEHDRIDQCYLSYEMSPVLAGRYPTITDVTVPETADFLEAFGAAGALRAETGPADAAHAKAYYQAVNELSQRWRRCEERSRAGRDESA